MDKKIFATLAIATVLASCTSDLDGIDEDEIFGPVSIQKLKTSDTYERAVEGYLPTLRILY